MMDATNDRYDPQARLRNRARDLVRDWRIRSLVPVVLLHLILFAALYGVMYRFAVSNLLNTHKFGASILMDELQFNFQDTLVAHTAPVLHARLMRQAMEHRLVSLNVFDVHAQPTLATGGGPSMTEVAEAIEVLNRKDNDTNWSTVESNGTMLFGAKAIPNAPACYQCHGSEAPRLGVLQMGLDLTQPMSEAKVRVRQRFAFIGVTWLALLFIMFGIRIRIIGKPLEQIEQALSDAATATGGHKEHDLDALAGRVNDKIWNILASQKQREQDIAKQMVRAEQLASLGEIAAGLTHEIKNPVAGVIAALDLMKSETAEDSETREVYDQMIGELRRASTTLESLLRLARPRPPQRTEVDLSRIVREVSTLFSARLRRQGVGLEVEIPDSVPTLMLDPTLIVQLLVNLLTNSMQATERGGHVKVILAPFPRRDGVVLAVSDTGRGIPREKVDHVFDPFFTTKEEGTGLGLAICRQIVEQHGGSISVESEEGKGTQFIILLPRDNRGAKEETHGALAAG